MSSNEYALITGATSGIGEEYARQLAAKGNNLIITGRREELLKKLKDELEDQGVSVKIFKADLSKQEGIDSLVAFAQKYDILYLVNNAGFANLGKFEEIDIEKHRNMLTVHMNASVELAHGVLPKMMQNDRGYIINVSSVAGLLNKGSTGLYGPTKAFLISFSRSLDAYLKDYNIIVQAFCPGYTYSGFHQTEEYKKHNADTYSLIPKYLWQTSEEVVKTSLDKLKKGRVVLIPNFTNKIARRLINWGIVRR